MRTIALPILLTFGWLFLFPATSNAQELEPYSVRPHISQVQSGSLNGWGPIENAQISFLAQIIELYPEYEIYFLMRDGENLYDLAYLLSSSDPVLQARIHALNVSRVNVQHPLLLNYLAQEGISENSLKAGKKILFVDTGLANTIPKYIKSIFPSQYRSQLRAQLIVSGDEETPSSRTFLATVNPELAAKDPVEGHTAIVNYEHMPHFTDRSTAFGYVGGHIEPLSPILSSQIADGVIDRTRALSRMQETVRLASQISTQNNFIKLRTFWKKLKELSQQSSDEVIVKELVTLLQDQQHSPEIEAMIRDYLEISNLQNPSTFKIKPGDVELPVIRKAIVDNFTGGLLLNADLKPYFEPYIRANSWGRAEESTEGIVKAIRENRWDLLKKAARTLYMQGFPGNMLYVVMKAPMNADRKEFIEIYLNQALLFSNSDIRDTLYKRVFTNQESVIFANWIRPLIETGDAHDKFTIAEYVLNQPKFINRIDLIEALIEKYKEPVLKTPFYERLNWKAFREHIRQNILAKVSSSDRRYSRIRKALKMKTVTDARTFLRSEKMLLQEGSQRATMTCEELLSFGNPSTTN